MSEPAPASDPRVAAPEGASAAESVGPAVSSGPRRLFPQAVLLLSLASFFNDVASELLLKGALPLYLVSVLGAPMVVVGLIDGLAEAVATLLQFLAGWWSDRVGRRLPFVRAGYALSNLTKPLLYFVGAWWQVLVIRVTDRVGKGLRVSPRDALIAEATPVAERGRAFGLNHALDPAGAAASLLAGALIITLSQDPSAPLQARTFQNLVLFVIVPGLTTLLLTALVREPRPAARVSTPALGSPGGLGVPYWRFVYVTVLFALGNSSDAFLVIRAWQVGASLPHLFVVLAAFNVMTVLFSLPAGWLSDRFGRKGFLALGWLLYAGVYAGFGYAQEDWQVLGLLLLYGVYYGLTEGVSKAVVADLVGAERRATAYGLLSAAQGMCVLPASLLAGWLWTAVSPATPFLVGSVLSLVAALGLVTVRASRKEA
jgi:MFS family permease